QKDEALASKVVASLEEAGLDAWYSKREIMPGDNPADKISEGLRESDAMVVLLTPSALDSNSVNWEIDYALGQKPFKRRLIPVIVGDSADFPSDRIPWIFNHLQSIRLQENGKYEEQLKQIVQVLKDAA
ncbi:MAG: toll/interleukin-1 receptor domain-containing protein, partial [Pyrinomonadaceae bacterium]